MKKIGKLVLSLSLSVVATGGIIGAGVALNSQYNDEYVDSFKGYVSDIVFDTKENTAIGYVENELFNETKSTTYVGYKKISSLSKSDIEKMGVLSLTDKEIIDGEEVSIEFKRSGISSTTRACIFNTGFGYIYFVPPVEIGGVIPNSYFRSIFDKNKYLNCTYNCNVSVRAISDSATIDSIYHQTIYFAGDKAHFDQDLPGITNEFYFLEKDDHIISYLKHPAKNDGKFYTLSEINNGSTGLIYKVYLLKGNEQIDIASLSKMDQIVSFLFSMDIDSSFFVKTNKGFSMTDDRYKDVYKSLLGSAASEEDIDSAFDDYHIHFRGDYYVNDDKLSSYQIVLTMTDNETIYAINYEAHFSNFGSTEIVMPS